MSPDAVTRLRSGASRKNAGKHRFLKLPWFRLAQLTISVVILSALVLSVPRLMNWLNQPITRVEVHASFNNLERDQVEQVMLEYLQDHFFELDLVGLRQGLLNMPWVKRATVRKIWPDRLIVTLREQQPIARWGQWQLISNDGEIFTPASQEAFASLPMLTGAKDESDKILQQYLAISQLLRPMGLGVSRLEQDDTGGWKFTAGHVLVNMGRDRKMERLQRFIRLYHARLESDWASVSRVDLRYLNGVAVARMDVIPGS